MRADPLDQRQPVCGCGVGAAAASGPAKVSPQYRPRIWIVAATDVSATVKMQSSPAIRSRREM